MASRVWGGADPAQRSQTKAEGMSGGTYGDVSAQAVRR
jgi:hypothetical protein